MILTIVIENTEYLKLVLALCIWAGVCGLIGYGIGYIRGAKMATKIGLQKMDELARLQRKN